MSLDFPLPAGCPNLPIAFPTVMLRLFKASRRPVRLLLERRTCRMHATTGRQTPRFTAPRTIRGIWRGRRVGVRVGEQLRLLPG